MESENAGSNDGTTPPPDSTARYDDPSAPDSFEPAPPPSGDRPAPDQPQAPTEQSQQPEQHGYAPAPEQPAPAEPTPYGYQQAPADPQYGYQQQQPAEPAPYGYQQPPADQQYGYQQQPTDPQYGYQQQQPYAGPPAYPGYGQPSGPPPSNNPRKPLLIALAAVVAIAVVIGVVVLATGGGSSSHKATAADAVKNYLQALADGDAAKALSYGPKPADTTLLNDIVLKKQQSIAKISNIEVNDDDKNSTLVEVKYSFGSQSVHDIFRTVKTDDEWKLQTTVVHASLLTDFDAVTLFGTPVRNVDSVFVFPGPLDIAFGSTYFTAKTDDSFETSPTTTAVIPLDAELSDAGKTAALTALKTAMTACAKSKSLSPDNCPQSEYGDNLPSDQFTVDDSATWTAPTDYSSVKLDYNGLGSDVYLDGTLTFAITYQSENIDDAKTTVKDTVEADLYGSIDMSKTPPVYED